MLRFVLLSFVLISVPLIAQTNSASNATPHTQVPVISADLGPCSAEFTVTSTRGKAIYNAKIAVEVKYGFGGFHKTALEIFTNTDGRARVEGLPVKGKRPLSFDVTYEGRATTVVVDPAQKCNGTYSAIVSDKVVAGDSEQ